MTESIACPYCAEQRPCKNDLLQHILLHHDGDMSAWPAPASVPVSTPDPDDP